MLDKKRNAVNKWFDEALSSLKAKTTADNTFTDKFFVSIAYAGKTYSNAAFLLLENNLLYPAMAIVRILGELTIKLVWCSIENESETPEIRLKRWSKNTLKEHKKTLKKALTSKYLEKHKKELQNDLKTVETYFEKIPAEITEMPSFANIFKELSDKEDLGEKLSYIFYKTTYRVLNSSVHLDPQSMIELYNNEDNRESIKIEYHCILFAYYINWVCSVEKFHKWVAQLPRRRREAVEYTNHPRLSAMPGRRATLFY